MKLLKENPDNIRLLGKKISYQESATFGFGYLDSELVELRISVEGKSHFRDGYFRQDLYYPGRIWFPYQLISFWKYPSSVEFRKIIEDLEEAFEVTLGEEWRVEVVFDRKSERALNFSHNEWENPKASSDYYTKLVSFQDYPHNFKMHQDLNRFW